MISTDCGTASGAENGAVFIATFFGTLIALVVAIGMWPSDSKRQVFRSLNQDWISHQRHMELLRPVLQQAWDGISGVRPFRGFAATTTVGVY